MRHFWIVLLAVAMAIVIALPATAKKPVPEPEPSTYDVTLTLFDDQTPGLDTTTCDEGEADPIRMFGAAGPRTLSLWDTDTSEEAPLIHVRAPDVVWERTYPTPSSAGETGFNECHGPSVYDGGIDDHPFTEHGGALSITIDYNAETVDFLWHFDYYIDAENLGKNKPRWVATVRENYTMSATASYNPSTGLVEGLFPISWSLKVGRVLVHSYDPFAPIEGTYMKFYMEVTPLG